MKSNRIYIYIYVYIYIYIYIYIYLYVRQEAVKSRPFLRGVGADYRGLIVIAETKYNGRVHQSMVI